MTKNKVKEQTALQKKEKSERELALAILLEVEKVSFKVFMVSWSFRWNASDS